VVIDEIQRRPDLFPLLRVLADRAPLSATAADLRRFASGRTQPSRDSAV